MGQIILCIDDQPVRYKKLRQLTQKLGYVVVTTCRWADFQEYLRGPDEIVGVCLDHDMPYQDGTYFAAVLGEKSHPVVITSMNHGGAQAIADILGEYWVPYLVLPCTTRDWESLALEFFSVLVSVTTK